MTLLDDRDGWARMPGNQPRIMRGCAATPHPQITDDSCGSLAAASVAVSNAGSRMIRNPGGHVALGGKGGTHRHGRPARLADYAAV
jgi:hypothetical protein